MSESAQQDVDTNKLQDMVAEADTGARQPASAAVAKLLAGTALAWSLFQLWYASPLPFVFNFAVFNDTEARSIHLAFAMFLAFTGYPALKRSPRDHVPVQDWIFALVGALCGAYLLIFYDALSTRPGAPITQDLVVAVIGMLLLLEATRRALGPPLMVVGIVFLTYTFAGPYMPEVISHKGASLAKASSHQWLGTEGVFGIALGVSTSFVFLFVLFGALLERAGAGNYFIKMAFAMLGHMRGGPAKAAVLASGMTGLISGSSIANVVTTGTFTIPLMKRMGLKAEKAGAVEVASSCYGQIMPPVMGAAAFLMVEYVGISYVQVIKHAFLPAVVAYMTFLYIMHLEALKADLKGLPRRSAPPPWAQRLLRIGINLAGFAVLIGVIYYGMAFIKDVAGDTAGWIIGGIIIAGYVALVHFGSRYPELEADDASKPIEELPDLATVFRAGLHFLLPVMVLVWALMVEQLSPGLSAFYATSVMIFILVTQRPLAALFRGRGQIAAAVRHGFDDLITGLETGARNMIGIGVATAAAGIVVGTVTLTGLGPVMTEFVEWLSGGSLIVMLVLIAVISLILGMGLPTTANYIVVSTLMAPVVVALGAQHGLIVPLIAVHLFVFYFGIMADITPPVGLAAFAASAISGADPIRTGVQAFIYAMLTAFLPFAFIFNTEIIMVGVDTVWFGAWTFFITLTGTCLFAAGTQGYFFTRNRIWESVLLVLLAFTCVRPGFWMDMMYPPYQDTAPQRIAEVAGQMPAGETLRLRIEFETLSGDLKEKVMLLPLGEANADGAARLESAGLMLAEDGERMMVDDVAFNSPAAKAGFDFDQRILLVREPTNPPAKQWMYIPVAALLALVVTVQRRRRDRTAGPTAQHLEV